MSVALGDGALARVAMLAADALAAPKAAHTPRFVRALSLLHLAEPPLALASPSASPAVAALDDAALPLSVRCVFAHPLRWTRALRALGGVAALTRALASPEQLSWSSPGVLAVGSVARVLVQQCLYALLVRLVPEDEAAARVALALRAALDEARTAKERRVLRAMLERRVLFREPRVLCTVLNAHAELARTAFVRFQRRVQSVLEGDVSVEHFHTRSELSAAREDVREALLRVTRLHASLDLAAPSPVSLAVSPVFALVASARTAALRFVCDASAAHLDAALFAVRASPRLA